MALAGLFPVEITRPEDDHFPVPTITEPVAQILSW